MQGLDVFVHEIVSLVSPATDHGQRPFVDDEVAVTGLGFGVPAGDGNDRSNTNGVPEQIPEFLFQARGCRRNVRNGNCLSIRIETKLAVGELNAFPAHRPVSNDVYRVYAARPDNDVIDNAGRCDDIVKDTAMTNGDALQRVSRYRAKPAAASKVASSTYSCHAG